MIVTRIDSLRLFAVPFLLFLGLMLINCGSDTTASVQKGASSNPEVSLTEIESSKVNASFVSTDEIPEFLGHPELPL